MLCANEQVPHSAGATKTRILAMAVACCAAACAQTNQAIFHARAVALDPPSCFARRCVDILTWSCGDCRARKYSTIDWSASASCKSAVIFPKSRKTLFHLRVSSVMATGNLTANSRSICRGYRHGPAWVAGPSWVLCGSTTRRRRSVMGHQIGVPAR
jgi:hypothetical protein